MKNSSMKKAFVFSLAMAALLALPTSMLAQGSKNGGLFGTSTEQNTSGMLQNGNRTAVETTGSINNQAFGEPVPAGSGIAILLLAGAGYVALKKKED